jgi:CHASE3 domain sensor protein
MSDPYVEGFQDAQNTIAEVFETLAKYDTDQSALFQEISTIVRNVKMIGPNGELVDPGN